MSTRRRDEWGVRAAATASEPEEQSAGSRRALLGAAGGFALATSGLLPEWLVEEVAADQHPVRRVQSRKEQKRTKQRHRREHRREVQRRNQGQGSQDASAGASGPIPKGIQLTVVNEFGARPNTFGQYWSGIFGWSEGRKFDIKLHSSDTLQTGELHAGALLTNPADYNAFVWAENPIGTPNVSVHYFGKMSAIGYRGGTTMIYQEMLDEQQETSTLVPWQSGNYRVTIRRESDTTLSFLTSFKVFTITLTVG